MIDPGELAVVVACSAPCTYTVCIILIYRSSYRFIHSTHFRLFDDFAFCSAAPRGRLLPPCFCLRKWISSSSAIRSMLNSCWPCTFPLLGRPVASGRALPALVPTSLVALSRVPPCPRLLRMRPHSIFSAGAAFVIFTLRALYMLLLF